MSQRCPYDRCDGSGFIVDEERRRAEPCACRPQRIARSRAHALSAVVPRRYRGVSFDRPPVTQMDAKVVRAVRRYVETIDERLEAGDGCWLTGDVGTGKTTLAMLISRSAMEAGHSVAIYSLPRLLAELRKTFDERSEISFLGLMDRLTSVELLHIDDLGAEMTTPWVLEQLYAIINARYEDGRSMVVTTNLDHEQLREQIGERTVSRLLSICDDHIIQMFGPDKRIRTAELAPERAQGPPGPAGPFEPPSAASGPHRGPGDEPEAWGTSRLIAGYGDARLRTTPPIRRGD